MILRFSTIVWMILVVVAAFGLYMVKYQVQAVREEVIAQEKKLREERDSLHVVQAEWAYLSRPQRLETLSQKHLTLQPMEGAQISDITLLPGPDETRALAMSEGEAPSPATDHPSMITPAGAQVHAR